MKLKTAIDDLEKLKEEYNNVRSLLVDQINDNEINEAQESFENLFVLKKSIEQMENLTIRVNTINLPII